jgi:hypothetical protein
MVDRKYRTLAEKLADGLTEEELSMPIELEGVDQVFTLRTLLPSLNPNLRCSPPADSSVSDTKPPTDRD